MGWENVVPQDLQDQTLPRKEAEAEQANSAVDQDENWQQDQVQLQEETLEEDQAGIVSCPQLLGSSYLGLPHLSSSLPGLQPSRPLPPVEFPTWVPAVSACPTCRVHYLSTPPPAGYPERKPCYLEQQSFCTDESGYIHVRQ